MKFQRRYNRKKQINIREMTSVSTQQPAIVSVTLLIELGRRPYPIYVIETQKWDMNQVLVNTLPMYQGVPA